jgi:hypothetical protein
LRHPVRLGPARADALIGLKVHRSTMIRAMYGLPAQADLRHAIAALTWSSTNGYSITSSARCCRNKGTSMPIAFAVFRLITRSNLWAAQWAAQPVWHP